jgi:hypothetical protein
MSIIELFAAFSQVLTKPTHQNLAVLLRGAILANGARTVTGCIRAASPWASKHFSAYENVLRRARMDQVKMARIMFEMVLKLVGDGKVIELIIDETVVRRYGPYVSGVSMHRDKVVSSRSENRMTPGNMWIVLAFAVKLPFLENAAALPILSVNYISPNAGRRTREGRRRHRTPCELAMIMVRMVARWMPGRKFRVIGDAWYASHLMADILNENSDICPNGSLVSRFKWDARLHADPGGYSGFGRPRIIGERILSPRQEMERGDVRWVEADINWYGGQLKRFMLLSGEGLWYRCSQGATWVRWVIVRDPLGRRNDEIFFTTDKSLSPAAIVECYVRRWNIEVTFEETRRHLGIATLRNRTHNAVNRSVPLLLSLYSLIIVWFASGDRSRITKPNAAPWYPKTALTFSDLIDCAKEDVISEFLSLHSIQITSEFLLAGFPLNIVYSLPRLLKNAA